MIIKLSIIFFIKFDIKFVILSNDVLHKFFTLKIMGLLYMTVVNNDLVVSFKNEPVIR